jgi:hypothetical protein
MAIEKIAEERIRKAMEEGAFDDLAGKGKPVDLKWYFELPENFRICYSILKSARIVPQEVELLKQIEQLKQQVSCCTDEKEKARLRKAISEKTMSFNILIERRRRKMGRPAQAESESCFGPRVR